VPVTVRKQGRRLRRLAPAAFMIVLACSGCDWFGVAPAITPQGERARNLWIGSCIAAMVVGVFVWGLIGWAVIRYRKRDDELPRQIRYNLPVEVLYTVVPFVIVMALFYYTAKDEIYIDKITKHPQVVVQVVGFRWSWQFNYVNLSEPDHLISITGSATQNPTLVVPEGETVLFELDSADVIHEWWVPALLFKRQNIPGLNNEFEVTLDKTGSFSGHCTQLCGTYHDRMNFTFDVVTQPQFQQFLATQRQEAASQPLTDSPTGAYVPGSSS
jgi:cytochrome c oxidase subunit 2